MQAPFACELSLAPGRLPWERKQAVSQEQDSAGRPRRPVRARASCSLLATTRHFGCNRSSPYAALCCGAAQTRYAPPGGWAAWAKIAAVRRCHGECRVPATRPSRGDGQPGQRGPPRPRHCRPRLPTLPASRRQGQCPPPGRPGQDCRSGFLARAMCRGHRRHPGRSCRHQCSARCRPAPRRHRQRRREPPRRCCQLRRRAPRRGPSGHQRQCGVAQMRTRPRRHHPRLAPRPRVPLHHRRLLCRRGPLR
jgi:hypothetical protein